jgi:hypothetical protein
MKLKAKREAGTGAVSNKSSEHFDIISLQYHNTHEGGRLRQHDEANRYRATMRTHLLHEKAHSVPHNIITGEARQSPAQLMARAAAAGQQQQ